MAMFSMLDLSAEGRKRRGIAFTCGLLAQALMIGTASVLGVLFPDALPSAERHYALTWLTPLPPPAKPVVAPPRRPAHVSMPKREPTIPQLPMPFVAHLDAPRIRHTVPSVAMPESPSAAPPVASSSTPPKAKEHAAIPTGIFRGEVELVTTRRPRDEVQTGGFGSPQGLPGQAQGGNPGNVPKLGLFALPEGPGWGTGTGGRRGIQGVVASAGFGSGVASPGYGHEEGGTGEVRVSVGNFERAREVAQSPARDIPASSPAPFQPVEILSKPAPVYTEEARRVGIQGEVALSVVFQSNGAIKVTGVVRSLGYGLDEAAEQAATQIRFKPALRAGQPADFPATLRIEFRLAGQST
jgi:TonB family protein